MCQVNTVGNVAFINYQFPNVFENRDLFAGE